MARQTPGSLLQNLKAWSISLDHPMVDVVRQQQLCWHRGAG